MWPRARARAPRAPSIYVFCTRRAAAGAVGVTGRILRCVVWDARRRLTGPRSVYPLGRASLAGRAISVRSCNIGKIGKVVAPHISGARVGAADARTHGSVQSRVCPSGRSFNAPSGATIRAHPSSRWGVSACARWGRRGQAGKKQAVGAQGVASGAGGARAARRAARGGSRGGRADLTKNVTTIGSARRAFLSIPV